MKTLESLSIFIGTGECNAKCEGCPGVPLRKYAPKKDGEIDKGLIWKTLDSSYDLGARYLSISSSGEPTLSPFSVTRLLGLTHKLERVNRKSYYPINLYTNGIRIGEDKQFCDQFLPVWAELGLSWIYLTIHDRDEKINASLYDIESYPSLPLIVQRIHENEMKVRANIVLKKKGVGTAEQFIKLVGKLEEIGIDRIAAWPKRNLQDKVDLVDAPSDEEMSKILRWAKEEHSSSGYDTNKLKILTEETRERYKEGKKLTLFPDGTLSNTWCN